MSKIRFYSHGDQSEDETSKFYCAKCDVFFEEAHFFDYDNGCCNHWERYDRAQRDLKTFPKTSDSQYFRPKAAVNVFTLNT